jgi:carboxypeptidase Q
MSAGRARIAGWRAIGALLCWAPPASAQARDDAARLAGALLGPTPMLADLQALNDEIGGRATGSPANLKAVDWALDRFRGAGVSATREAFRMPRMWLERSASVAVRGEGIEFTARAAAMPFSTGTGAAGRRAPLVDGGRGSDDDLKRLGTGAKGAWVLIEQDELTDVPGLFKEYAEVAALEPKVMAAGALGVAYMGSRPDNLLYRHNAADWAETRYPALVVERDAARRAQRLLRNGKRLELTAFLDLVDGGPYDSYNVVGEIRGAVQPDEIIVLGAHLDSWDLGTGALDNGANAVMLIDIARQMVRLGIRPARTIRFALWNGEEQGMYGSLGYTKAHAAELDRHVMVTSIDIGTGRITGFFTNGRAEIMPAVERSLEPVRGLGPFTLTNAPIVGTDNFDFMLEGVANLVPDQASANYGPNYHARSDEFHQADPIAMRQNAAIVAAMTLGIAATPYTWGRQSKADIDRLVATTDLEQQMRQFGLWEPYRRGERGRK